jgi:YlmC/YmxH family sporulation protein
MRLCDLREKEVINICDGERLGFIEDMEFDLCSGAIYKVIIPGPCKVWGILGREFEYVIDIRCIRQVGEDVILVEVDTEKVKCSS